jgi:hypothetical protein
MSQLIIPGALQYKTSLAWGSGGDALVESFTLQDKEIAIVKVSHIYAMYGSSNRRVTSTPPWEGASSLYINSGDHNTPYYAPTQVQSGVRILRVGSTLYTITLATFNAIFAANGWYHSNGISAETYTYTLQLATNTVSGIVGALSTSTWDVSGNSGIDNNGGYDYQVQGFMWSKSPLYFSNIQIFNPGF